MALEHFLSGPEGTQFENLENADILVNTVKVAFLVIKNGKTQPFSKIGILHTYSPTSVLIHIFRFLTQNFLSNSEKNEFYDKAV